MKVINLPRNERTPKTEVDLILSNLSYLYDELHPGQEPYLFINTYFKELYENEHTSGDVLADFQQRLMIKAYGKSVIGTSRRGNEASLVISCAFCCQALRAFGDNRVNEAWTYVVDAHFWCGLVLQGAKRINQVKMLDHKKEVSKKMSENRKRGIDRYDYSDFILKEYEKGGYKTKTVAIKSISAALLTYIEDNNLPRKNFKLVTERGAVLEEPQRDFTRMVMETLKHISAKQVKADYLKFLKQK